MMKLSVIFIDKTIANVYVNTGQYVHKVAEEMVKKGYGDIRVIEYVTTLNQEKLLEFITENSTDCEIFNF